MRRMLPGASLALALLVGCASSDDAAAPPRTVYAAYVLLGPGAEGATAAFARAIVDPGDPPCPTLEATGAALAMTRRLNPHGFSVDVCEARVPFGREHRVSWSGDVLPAVRLDPSRLAVLGDTGCKEKDCRGDVPASPFAQIAATASRLEPRPDLILHLGDYNYRGTEGSVPIAGGGKLAVYDAGDDAPDDPLCQLDSPYVSQNAAYSENPDRWQNWWLDFFAPAQPLLGVAPWVFVRGNHELCSRAGPGWFYFLDAGAEADTGGTGQLACPPQGGASPPPPPIFSHLRFGEPYTLDLGTLRLAVLDSANACDDFSPAATTSVYAAQLREVLNDVRPGTTTWIATHRPFWGATEPAAEPPAYDSINQTLQQAWSDALDGSAPPPEVTLLVAGHMHAFQSATFTAVEARPPQLVVGNGGVELSTSSPGGAFDAVVDGQPAAILGILEHGFLAVSALAADGSWSGHVLDENGDPIATCATGHLPGALCVASPPP